jgi:hypothetical protein
MGSYATAFSTDWAAARGASSTAYGALGRVGDFLDQCSKASKTVAMSAGLVAIDAALTGAEPAAAAAVYGTASMTSKVFNASGRRGFRRSLGAGRPRC